MNLPKDPVMLYSVINLKLRDHYSDLNALCDDMDVNKEELLETLRMAGYEYQEATNQFL